MTARPRSQVPAGRREGPGLWCLTLPRLAPNLNHTYYHKAGGGMVLTADARSFRRDVELACMMAHFEPQPGRLYEVGIDFTYPTWRTDIDAGIKGCLDSTFGARHDQRVIGLSVSKRVVKGCETTVIRIRDCTED